MVVATNGSACRILMCLCYRRIRMDFGRWFFGIIFWEPYAVPFRENFARSLIATLSRKIWAMPLGVHIS